MDLLNAIIIGIIQGLTEFLPVSSSGHLVIAQRLLGVEMPGLTFEIFLHFGTLISVFWVFRERIAAIFMSVVSLLSPRQWDRFQTSENRRFLFLLIVGSIPTALIALFARDMVEEAFASTRMVGYSLIVTGALLWVADVLPGGNKDINKTRVSDVLLIGVFQGLAVLPGISRSGSTISGALFRRLDKRTAAEYSFLLSVPAIGGATVLELITVLRDGTFAGNWLFFATGVLVAALSGIFAIRVFLSVLVKNRLRWFGLYCWAMALVAIFIL